MSHWAEYMSTASDEAIMVYIRDHKQYVPEAVEAAIAELASRGKPLPEEQIHTIRGNVAHVQQMHRSMEMESYNNDHNVTEAYDAPELYSPGAIYGFTVFFGALFGGVLFCLNLSRINKQSYILVVLVGALAYTVLQMLAGAFLNLGSSFTIVSSIGAGLIYQKALWPRLAGENLQFRKRSILFPLLMGLGLLAAIFWLVYNQI